MIPYSIWGGGKNEERTRTRGREERMRR